MRHLTRLVASVLAVLLLLPAAAFATGAPAFERAPINPDFKKAQKARAKGLLSYRASPVDLSGLAGASTVPPQLRLPAAYDLRTKNKVTPVKDQGDWGTCWAFSALASMESCLLPNQRWDFSEISLAYWHGYDWGLNEGGNDFIATAVLTRWGGPLTEKQDPYHGDTHPKPTSKLVQKHVQNVLYLSPRAGALDNDAIKQAVMDYGAVSSVMHWPDSSAGEEVATYYNDATGAYYYDGNEDPNHTVTIVGWDDTYAASNFTKTPDGDGAFLIKNSWGTGWGNDGYFWISYYDTQFAQGSGGVSVVYCGVESPKNYARVYQYDPLGWTASGRLPGSDSWAANCFKAAQNGTLRAVGFYTVAPDTTYEVYTGSSLTERRLQASGTFGDFGYHTVKLSTPVKLTAGRTFYVIVKLDTPDVGGEQAYDIAMERPLPDYSSKATALAGQSYLSRNGQDWKDLTTPESEGGWGVTDTNVCLKAYQGWRKAWVSKPTAPKTMRRGKAARVRGFLKPRHKAGTYPVRVYKERYVSRKWRKAGYVRARASNYSSYSRYTASVKFGQRGKWRLRAFHPAGVGQAAAVWSKGYTYVRVR